MGEARDAGPAAPAILREHCLAVASARLPNGRAGTPWPIGGCRLGAGRGDRLAPRGVIARVYLQRRNVIIATGFFKVQAAINRGKQHGSAEFKLY